MLNRIVKKENRMSPFVDIVNLFEESMDSVLKGMGHSNLVGSPDFIPNLKLSSNDKYAFMEVEVPGMTKDDLSISVDGYTLVVQGEKTNKNETNDGHVLKSEIEYGKFRREVKLTQYLDVDKIEATCSNGVLFLKIPKVIEENPPPKQIEIKD